MYARLRQIALPVARAAVLPAILALCMAPARLPAADTASGEYQVKAAFLYNFSRFVAWPGGTGSAFRLCVIGDNPFGDLLDSLTGKQVHDSILVVEQHDSVDGAQNCHLAYISKSLEHRLDEVLDSLGGMPVLTVSDIESFTTRGGIIRLRMIDNRVRFDINTAVAGNAGLSISSKLLSLATSVETEQ